MLDTKTKFQHVTLQSRSTGVLKMQGDKEISLVIAAKEFFGLRPETTLKDFTEEWKQLTDADKQEIRTGLIANGYNIKA